MTRVTHRSAQAALHVRKRLICILTRWQAGLRRYRTPLVAVSILSVVAAAVIGFVTRPESPAQLTAFRVVIVADLIAIYLWAGIYTLLQPWWQSQVGRSLVFKDLALSVPFWILFINLFFGFSRFASKFSSALDMAALTTVAVVLLVRSDIWVSEHAKESGEADEPPGDAGEG